MVSPDVSPTRLVLDVQTRWTKDRRTLLGGAPFQVLRLTEAGKRHVEAFVAGTGSTSQAATSLYRRVVDAGLAHPVASSLVTPGSVGAVVPVFNDAAGLELLLPALRARLGDGAIVVVDDGSTEDVSDVALRFGCVVVAHQHNRGAAAARNTGWRHLAASKSSPEFVLFVDADIASLSQSFDALVAHLVSDPMVAVVAPRVSARPAEDGLSRYEACDSPLDLGEDPARAAPISRVPYVPSAVMIARLSVLDAVDGFDESMPIGEDVDLLWRVVDAGHSVRYEPSVVVTHRSRATLSAMARQRFRYGTSGALIEQRHPGTIFPVEVSLTHGAAWAAAIFGGPWGRAASVVGVGLSVQQLDRKLSWVGADSLQVSADLIKEAHVGGLGWLANACTRAWAPLLVAFSRTRPIYAAALVLPALAKYLRRRPALDPFRYMALRWLDHTSYCAGLWVGAIREHTPRVLVPRFRRQ